MLLDLMTVLEIIQEFKGEHNEQEDEIIHTNLFFHL